MTSTKVNTAALREAADGLERIMGDMSVFTALRASSAKVGDFEAAKLLEMAVNDRRDGVVGQADLLRVSLSELGSMVAGVANDFDAVDRNNAGKISASSPERQV